MRAEAIVNYGMETVRLPESHCGNVLFTVIVCLLQSDE